MYSAVYEATVPDGRTLRCTSGIATSWQSPPVGTVATLLYRPHDPSRPLVTLGFSRFLFATIFAGVAAFLTVTAIPFAFSAYRVPKTVARTVAPADSAQPLPSAVAEPSLTHVTGNVHSAGGDLGTWDIVLSDCQSGEVNGFYGVDFYVAGSDHLRLRYVHDEAMGDIVKVGYPSKPGTVNVFDRDSKCSILEGSIEKTNYSTRTSKGSIRHLNGHLKFDCRHADDKNHVTGEVTFSHCY
jgi:hypothetical protein